MQCVLRGCPKLRKLEIRDCPFGNAALLSGLEKYESMRSLWISACNVTMNGCRLLAREMPRLNVEVMEDGSDDSQDDKVYVYRSIAGPRRDAPSSVLTLSLSLSLSQTHPYMRLYACAQKGLKIVGKVENSWFCIVKDVSSVLFCLD